MKRAAEVGVSKKGLTIVLMMSALALPGCQSKPPATVSATVAAPAATPPRPPAPSTSEYQTSGPLVVENQVEVEAQREGVVAAILADVGKRVHKGDLLARLDDRQLSAEREAAAADLRGGTANLQNWQAECKVLEVDYARDRQLWDAQLITQQQLDHSRHKYEAARFQIERDEANIVFYKAKLRATELELEKTRITAPFEGVVARRYARVGEKVTANDRLFWVTATGPLKVRFTLPQEFVGKLKINDEVAVSAPGSTEKHPARISLLSPVVDPSSATIEVQAQLQGTPASLLPGMTVNINLRRPQ